MWGLKPEKDQVDEPIAEWIEVGDCKGYCPTQADIDRPLRLDILPMLKDGSDATKGGMSITTGTVIPTPKEARTRRMISNGGTFNAEWLSQQFKVMNWNVLADLYCTESMYPYAEKWTLSWTWRKHLILKELKSMAADIITLQEVQKDAYDDWFKPQLAEAGYEGIYQQKKREPIFHRGKYIAEGCATFYKITRFKRIDKHVIDYDKLSSNELQCTNLTDNSLQRLSKGNIAVAVILEDLSIKATHSNQAQTSSGGHLICVVNTHILADPGFTDVKLWQANMLLRSLEQLHVEHGKHLPMLLCGDFNSTPESAVYELLRSGSVGQEHEDFKVDPCGLLKRQNFTHSLSICTSYETCNGREADYTNYTEDFKGTLDYIWYSSDSLAVLAISQVDEESQLTQETALPSSTRPSDHVSLVATFKFRDHRDNSNDPVAPVRNSNRNHGSMANGGLSHGGSVGPNHYQHLGGGYGGNGVAGGYGNNPFTSANSNSFHTACALSHAAQYL
jgi:CCR4-NOT transcription complex subunit 6